MTFKISFSADSLEGLTALAGLATSVGKSGSVSVSEGILPPPQPSSQSMEVLDNITANPGFGAPPPSPGGGASMSGNSNSNELAPPAPPIQGMGISGDLASSSDQVAPPPMPDSLNPNAVGGMAQGETSPPPGPPKRQTKRPKKAAKN